MAKAIAKTPRRWGVAGPIFDIDGRTKLARRIDDIAMAYANAIGGDLSAVQFEQVMTAAQLAALAEAERAKLADGIGTVDDVVRLENLAGRAFKVLQIKEADGKPPKSQLAEYLASKAGQ